MSNRKIQKPADLFINGDVKISGIKEPLIVHLISASILDEQVNCHSATGLIRRFNKVAEFLGNGANIISRVHAGKGGKGVNNHKKLVMGKKLFNFSQGPILVSDLSVRSKSTSLLYTA